MFTGIGCAILRNETEHHGFPKHEFYEGRPFTCSQLSKQEAISLFYEQVQRPEYSLLKLSN